MSNLVIHSNNISNLNLFDKSIKFNPNSSDIDRYITLEILPKILNENFERIYIKDSLSDNYLDFYGLILTYHIRLSNILTPIIIISSIEYLQLHKITPLAKILSTKAISIIENSAESISKSKTKILKPLKKDEYEERFLNLIEIEEPKDLSHHDISNEWSIERWSQFLNITSDSIESNRTNISSMLYFKYLIAKYPIKTKKTAMTIIPKPPKTDGKILYIDDEWSLGWFDIFDNYFKKSKNIIFETIQESYKDRSYSDIEQFIFAKIELFEPDLILLDIRLTKDDHNYKKDNELSGIKLLKSIKSKNRAIGVILLTASNRGSILKEANLYKPLGYIKKESPQDREENLKDKFKEFKELIDFALERKYLLEIWKIQTSILSLNLFKLQNSKIDEMRFEIENLFEILDSTIENRFKYAMLSIFKVLEIIIKFYIYDDSDFVARWIDSKERIYEIKRQNSTENKIRNILNEKLNIKNVEIHNLIESITKDRNSTIHPNNKIPTIDKDKILKWFDMLKSILVEFAKEQK